MNNTKFCKRLYEYSTIEKPPTENEDLAKIYIFEYCKKIFLKTIPKLNEEDYY